ncbi:maternal embryonic leucine zipper kinase-like isoform X2 [Bacillus rossius redtenbacheri]|uniref:maternal embryonic leucine zipper kinase-like isoform X2 n=1 Tax=Bacillus rossius redtenbacheri TaxID=93214 RepID=UPI002FDDDDC4
MTVQWFCFRCRMVRYGALKGLYEVQKTIGCGGFAKVKVGIHVLTGEKVAIKIMEKNTLGEDLPRVKMEIEALKSLSHHHICKLYQVIETPSHYFLVMEYCAGGELFDHIVSKDRLGEGESRSFFRQIVSAVAHLHEKGFVHRDLKPENILLGHDDVLKLIDFGLCARPGGQWLNTSCGSPTYAAPELVLGKRYIGSEVDVWSLGVLLYALLCGSLPFDDKFICNLYQKILSGKYEEPPWLSSDTRCLIRSMLQVDPKKRIKMEKLLHHPWLMLAYGEPVSSESLLKFKEYNEECVQAMCQFHMLGTDEMWERLSAWHYDYDTATYQLLVERRRRGLPARLLLRNRRVVDEPSQSQSLDSFPRRGVCRSLNETFVKPKGQGSPRVGNSPLITDDSPYVMQRRKQQSKEDAGKDGFASPLAPTPRRRSMKRYRSPGPENVSPVPLKMTPARARDRAAGKTVASSSESCSSPSCFSPAETPKSARKMLGILGGSLSKVRHVLTRKKMCSESQPALLNAKGLCNVSTTSCSNPETVLNQLQQALGERGVACSLKGFTLRGKVEESAGEDSKAANCKLSFELEVCLVPSVPQGSTTVGIRRKRLKGDAWCYKRICEELGDGGRLCGERLSTDVLEEKLCDRRQMDVKAGRSGRQIVSDPPSARAPSHLQAGVSRAMIVAAVLLCLLLRAGADPRPFLFRSNGPKELTVQDLSYSSCVDNGIVTLTNVTVKVSDDRVTAAGALSIAQDISSLSVDLDIKWKSFIKWKCRNGVGSCHYDNVCDILNKHTDTCERQMQQFNQTLPCSCPIKKGNYTLQEMSMPLDRKWEKLMTGTHTCRVTGSVDGQQVLCYVFRIKLAM